MSEDTITQGEITQIPLEYLADFNFLTPGQAIIVYLADECGLSYAEIGKKIGRKGYNIEKQHIIANEKISAMYKQMEEQMEREEGIFGKVE